MPLTVVEVTELTVGSNVSTLKLDDVTCEAGFPAASLTSAVNVYEEPSVKACNPEAVIATVALLLETDPVYVALFNVIVTICSSSTPEVVTVTVPFELSSVAFNTAPQESALVAIALI